MALGAFSSAFSSAFDIGSQADTHDGGTYYPSRREIAAIRKRLQEAEAARQQELEDERRAEARLEAALRRAFRRLAGEPEDDPVLAVVASAAPDAVVAPERVPSGDRPAPRIDFGLLAADFAGVARLLAEFERRLADEEEDIAVLILAMA